MSLHGKVAIVTGGTGALGGSVVEALLQDGARIVVASRSLRDSSANEKDRMKVFAVRSDVTKESDVASLFQQAKNKIGNVEILVNLAGGYLPGRAVVETEAADWDEMMALNLRSVFLCCREYLRNIHSRKYGRIINIATIHALELTAGKGAYAISKAGVVALTRMMSEELRGTGVTVNTIAPGIIRTTANIVSMPDADHDKWVAPDEIARLIVHLCSEQGKSITGACIPMSEGH